MTQEIELSSIDLRYEGYRMKNPGQEKRLLASIAERGVEEPLEGVDVGEERILLNGFKRYRCARRLRLAMVPYKALGEDEASGIIAILRSSNNRSLSILEQARFIDDLRTLHGLALAEIAELLSRSKAWVSMRVGLLGQMSQKVREKIFDGDFPIYSYMYTLRKFMRMNREGKQDVEDFVEAVAGKNLSVRDLEILAHGYFRGGDSLREQIREGKLFLVLEQMRELKRNPEGSSEFERALLMDLEIVQKYMGRVVLKHRDKRLESRLFYAEANLLTAGALSRVPAFRTALKELYDRSGDAQGGFPSASSGVGRTGDSP
jgi:predicted transcriptional regulator